MCKIIFSIFIALSIATVSGQTYNEMDSLIGHLFNESRYNKFLRPLRNQSHLMKVNFTQYLTDIEYFDISTGVLLITGFFEITWTDELLTWSTASYGGKQMIPLPKGKFWKPEISLEHGPANDESSIYSNGFSPAWVSSQGSVTMIPGGSYQTRCDVDTTLYPYDIHTCYFKFIVSNHDASELMLIAPSNDVSIDNLKENGEWEMENTDAKVVVLREENIDKVSIPMFQASLSLKRRPTFEIMNTYAPITLMSSLNMATCFVRPNSGERLTFAVTLYLSLVFATTAAIGKIPSNSLKMPLLSYELLISNCVNAIGVIWSIFIVNLANKSIIKKRFPCFVAKLVQRKRKKMADKLKPAGKPEVAIPTIEYEGFSDENKSKRKPQNNLENAPLDDITGLEVAEVLDTVYFWFVTLFILVYNVLFGVATTLNIHANTNET